MRRSIRDWGGAGLAQWSFQLQRCLSKLEHLALRLSQNNVLLKWEREHLKETLLKRT